jgi:preprotein translocase subunit SecD
MRRKLLTALLAILFVSFGGLIGTLIAGNKPALGLDLQGGISVTQQPIGQYDPASLDLAVDRIRERVDSLGVSEPEIIRQGDAIVVNLPGVKNQQQAIDLVKVTGQVYLRPVQQCIAGSPVTSSTTPTGSTAPASATTIAGSATTVASATTAAAAVGTVAPSTSAGGGPARAPHGLAPSDTTLPVTTTPVTTTPVTTGAPASTTASTVATDLPTSVPVNTFDPATATSTTRPVSDPTTQQVLPLKSGGQCLVGAAGGEGTVFQNDASADIIAGSGWGVTVGLRDGAGGLDVWNRLASACFNGDSTCPSHQLAIELDGLIISAPSVNEPRFTGNVQITGSFTETEAKNLARVLKSGSLPVRMQTQSVETVSPTLGKDSLHAAIISGLIGVALVLLFMMLYYRSLGIIVFAGITVSGALIYSIISLLSKTQGLALSLSGVAGVIVSVGVTVDSYVVFFERLKDEVRSGRTMRNSAQRGFVAAWRTILVADLVSLIGAAVLWYLTVGSVRNFAFFLGLSTLCDLIVAWMFTRPAVLLLARTDWMAKRKVMGIEAIQQVATIAGGAS